MKPVEQYIAKLLKDNDCVIVPEAGGFFTVQRGARYEPDRHMFKAPGKFVSFNGKLTHNDGLLISAVAEEEGVDYSKAKEHVEQFAQSLLRAFSEHKGVSLSGLGTLYFDENTKLRFDPDESVNYDEETFALESFRAEPVEKVENQKVKSTGISDFQRSEPKNILLQKAVWKRAAAAVIMIPVAGYLAWLLFFTGILSKEQSFHAADLNPFTEKKCEVYKPRTAEISALEELNIKKPVITFNSGIAELRLIEEEGAAPIIVKLENTITKAEAKQTFDYYVMAGAFRNEVNARNFVQDLKNYGFEDALMIDVKNGLYRVSAGGASTRSQADNLLRKVRVQVQPGAWVLTEK